MDILNLFKKINILDGLLETIYMVIVSTIISYVLGILIGVVLVATEDKLIIKNKIINKTLNIYVNLTRSIPFIILLVLLIPLTRLIVGTAIGPTAMIVPLSFAATSFVGRLVESTIKEIDRGVIEQAICMGATPIQIIFNVYLTEAKPALIRGLSITAINLIGYSAMAGTVAGGGLGDLAIRYGYYQYDYLIMFSTVIILIIIVQITQKLIDYIAIKIDKK